MKKVFMIISNILLLFTFICCKTVTVQQNIFNGMVYDGDNEPLAGVNIIINNKVVATTDMYGRFYISDLKTNTDYELTTEKKGYEDTVLKFNFQNITQVAYLKVFSAEQLLKNAELLIEKENYSEAKYLITRNETCNGKTLSSQYLLAVILYKQQDYNSAKDIIIQLENQGYKDCYIYLFAADIFQYGLRDSENAKIYLKKYLETNFDSEIQKRYNDL